MELLTNDIFSYLAVSYLNDNDKYNLIATSKELYNLRFVFIFNNPVKYRFAKHLSYFDNFTNIIINNSDMTKKTIKVKTINDYNQIIIDYDDIKLPKSAICLSFGDTFNK